MSEIEKDNPAGLRIGKYGPLPAPEGETPSFYSATGGAIKTYTGFKFMEHRTLLSDVSNHPPTQTTMIDWSWSTIPWYARLLGLLRLPYDLTKFVITGRLIVIPWPWRF